MSTMATMTPDRSCASPITGLMTPPHTPPPVTVLDLDENAPLSDRDPSLPPSPTPPAVSLPADAFPHIIDAIFAHSPAPALATLRAVSRAWRDRADARLLHHLVLQDDYVPLPAAGGPLRSNWLTTSLKSATHTLDIVNLDLASMPIPLPPRVHTLRAHSIERWRPGAISALPASDTLVLFGRLSDRSFGPESQNWAPYIAHNTRRLVAHYNARAPELGAWGVVGAALALPSCGVQEVVFIFGGEADEVDVSLLGALLMLSMQLGWHIPDSGGGGGGLAPITLVNALPWFAAGLDRGEVFKGDTEGDVVALFYRAAGFGRGIASDDELKARYGHCFKFVSFDEYRDSVGEEQYALEMEVPRRVGARPVRGWCSPKKGAAVSVRPAETSLVA